MAGSHDAERICEEILQIDFVDEVEKMVQQQTVLFNDYDWSDDLFASLDKEDYDLLQKCIAEFDLTLSDCDIPSYPVLQDLTSYPIAVGSSQIPNTVRQPDMDFKRLMTGDYVSMNSEPITRSGHEMEFGVQEQLLQIELQEQMHNLTLIQQNPHITIEEQKRQKQEQVAEESSVIEVQSMRTQSENVSTNDLPLLLCVPNQLDSHGLESVHTAHTWPCNKKRVITLSNDKVPLDAEQAGQIRLDIFVDSGDSAAEKSPVVREKSKMHICQKCGKGFIFTSHLIRHTRSHTGEKPFQCGYCGSRFAQMENLIEHRRTHTGEKPFKCGKCDASFSHRSALTRHSLIHTRTRPPQCNVCKKTFRNKTALSKHCKVHVKDKE